MHGAHPHTTRLVPTQRHTDKHTEIIIKKKSRSSRHSFGCCFFADFSFFFSSSFLSATATHIHTTYYHPYYNITNHGKGYVADSLPPSPSFTTLSLFIAQQLQRTTATLQARQERYGFTGGVGAIGWLGGREFRNATTLTAAERVGLRASLPHSKELH